MKQSHETRGASAFWVALALTTLASPLHAQEFAARTVNIVIGFAPGGGYDVYGRFLARHLGKHLPGNPVVVAQNMPGGGSLNLANFTANAAGADGSHIALINSAAALEPVLGNPEARFETARLRWVGNMNRDSTGCASWTASGVTSWEDVFKRGAKFGGVGAAGTSSQHAFYMKNLLTVPISVITGYRGSNEVNLALQRGEVDATCGLFLSSMRGPYRQDHESGKLRMLIQFGRNDEPYFKGAVNVYSMLKTDEEKQVTDFIFGQAEISRPLALPPATPAAIVTTIRRAFDRAMKDPELRADAERAGLDIASATGEETEKEFARYAGVSKAIAARALAAIRP